MKSVMASLEVTTEINLDMLTHVLLCTSAPHLPPVFDKGCRPTLRLHNTLDVWPLCFNIWADFTHIIKHVKHTGPLCNAAGFWTHSHNCYVLCHSCLHNANTVL